jgi:hypothetical protein
MTNSNLPRPNDVTVNEFRNAFQREFGIEGIKTHGEYVNLAGMGSTAYFMRRSASKETAAQYNTQEVYFHQSFIDKNTIGINYFYLLHGNKSLWTIAKEAMDGRGRSEWARIIFRNLIEEFNELAIRFNLPTITFKNKHFDTIFDYSNMEESMSTLRKQCDLLEMIWTTDGYAQRVANAEANRLQRANSLKEAMAV